MGSEQHMFIAYLNIHRKMRMAYFCVAGHMAGLLET